MDDADRVCDGHALRDVHAQAHGSAQRERLAYLIRTGTLVL